MKQGKELAQILNNLENLVNLAANDKLNIQQKNQVNRPRTPQWSWSSADA